MRQSSHQPTLCRVLQRRRLVGKCRIAGEVKRLRGFTEHIVGFGNFQLCLQECIFRESPLRFRAVYLGKDQKLGAGYECRLGGEDVTPGHREEGTGRSDNPRPAHP